MRVVLLHNHYDKKHLVEVMAEMEKLGVPTIRGFWNFNGDFQAIEGCHRLRAAAALGITPDFDEYDGDTLRSEFDDLDYSDGLETDPEATIDSMGDWENTSISFDD